MFKFLKGLFKQELEKYEVNINELSIWFESKTESAFEDIKIGIKEGFNEIKETLANFKEHISMLENAEIQDANKIQDKIKQVVLGHRTSYTRVLSHFVDSIEIPEEIDYKEGNRIISEIEENLDNIGKNTTKSYYAVQHLFHSELEKITKDLKQLDSLVKQIKEKIQKSKVIEIDEIKQKITELIDAIEKKKDIGKQLKDKGGALLNLENSKQKFEDDIKGLRKGNDFLTLESLKKELEETEDLIKQKESEIVQLFSPLESGLRKFKRITLENEELVGEYADSAVKALLKDKALKIIGLLGNMKKNILSGGIDLRDRKRERTLESIDAIFPQKLKGVVSEHNSLLGQRENIKKQLSANPAKSSIKEIEYKLEHILFKTNKLKEEVVLIEKKYNQINIGALRKELEKKIKEAVNAEVIINL